MTRKDRQAHTHSGTNTYNHLIQHNGEKKPNLCFLDMCGFKKSCFKRCIYFTNGAAIFHM